MPDAIGVLATRHIWVAAVENGRIAERGARMWPEPGAGGTLDTLPAPELAACMAELVTGMTRGRGIGTVGVGFPGIIRAGVIEESPNLPQVKGFALRDALSAALRAPVVVLNDADALAAGIASTRGQLEGLVRVWYLADGVGFGRYPRAETPWEAGHTVVSLDPKERYCGCGGAGHLEGIMGHRAMRKRFLDMEPEEVFAAARSGDERCAEFVKLWHRALAAASATNVHLEGPGKFFIAGPNAEFVDMALLGMYVHEMVGMSPLQGSSFEIVESSHELALIGAAVTATRHGR